jgi:hypothetical protein
VNAALMDAIVNGRYRMVQYVVEGTSGFDINGQTSRAPYTGLSSQARFKMGQPS